MIESVDFMIDESPGSVMRGNVEDAARIGALADKVQRDFTDGLEPELTAEESDVLTSAIWEHVHRFRRELDSTLDMIRIHKDSSDPDQSKLAELRIEQKNLQRDHQKHGPQSLGLSGQMSILSVLSGAQDLAPKMVRKWVVMLTDLADKQTERASWSRYNNNSADSQMRAHMWTPTQSSDYPRRELLLKYESHIRNQLRKDYASLSTVRGLLPAARP